MARTRVMFGWVIVLPAANADKQPAAEAMATAPRRAGACGRLAEKAGR
ncbi:hypothetical protein OHA01_02850 [Micromonospora zamorensis]|nr:hypothetical protein OHA01_02850 [Micromonospora zamorensis]